jgi:hypothetical protein
MREIVILSFLCLFLALVSLGAMVWGGLTMPLFSLDGLLLAAICGTLATFFAFCFVWFAYEARLWEALRRKKEPLAAPAPAEAEK